MAKFTNLSQNFTMIPNWLINNQEISLKAKGLFIFLASKPNNFNFSAKGLSKLNKEGVTSINNCLKELENIGLLIRKKIKGDDKRFIGIEYILMDKPLDGNTVSGKPTDGKPNVGKPTNINNKDLPKKEINNKEINNKEVNNKNIFVPPTLEEVKSYFKEKGYKEETAITAFEYYNVSNWHDKNNNQVKNWKQKMISVWFKEENKISLPTQMSFEEIKAEQRKNMAF